MKKRYTVKRIWVILFAVAAILAAVGGTLAIYTSQVYQRAVVRNRYNDVIRFSSDKLYRVAGDSPTQKYYYPMDQGQTTMTFSVCNYDQEKNTLFSEKKIDYTITFTVRNGTDKVTNGTDNYYYTVSCGDQSKTLQNNGNVSMTGSLPGGKRSVDSYTVTFAEGDYNKVEIEVTVTPTDSTTTQNRILNAVLIPIEYATTQGVRVHYEYPDSKRSGTVTPDQFDAYNLLVSVSGGVGNVVIAWDASELDIDPFFKAKGTSGTAANGYTTLTVPMNAEDETGTYLISFYNHNTTKPVWTAWSNLPITVTLAEPTSEPTIP